MKTNLKTDGSLNLHSNESNKGENYKCLLLLKFMLAKS